MHKGSFYLRCMVETTYVFVYLNASFNQTSQQEILVFVLCSSFFLLFLFTSVEYRDRFAIIFIGDNISGSHISCFLLFFHFETVCIYICACIPCHTSAEKPYICTGTGQTKMFSIMVIEPPYIQTRNIIGFRVSGFLFAIIMGRSLRPR